MAVVRRMDRESRRQQLLAVALDLVRQDGTDALTLARLAEAAGVTKPVVYRQFVDRPGLLKALYADYDDRQHAAMQAAVADSGDSLASVARIVAGAYVDCILSAGPEMTAITAALSASGDMEAFRESLRQSYLEQFHSIFRDFAGPASRAEYVAILGASDALAQAIRPDGLSRDAAVETLTRIIISVLSTP